MADASYQEGVYIAQGANELHIASGASLILEPGSIFSNQGVKKLAGCTLTPAASTTNVCLVTIQFVDGSGAALGTVIGFDWWLSDSATGYGYTGTTASGTVQVSTPGQDLSVMVAKKATASMTDATGKYVLGITDSAKTGFYVVASCGGSTFVSAQLVAANYG